MFGGNRALFIEAQEKGQVYKKDDDLWYYDAHRQSTEDIKSQCARGSTEVEVESSKLLGIMSGMMEAMGGVSSQWVQVVEKQPVSKRDNGKVTDNDYRVLQESFDSVTRVTSAICQVSCQTKDCV